MSSRLRTALVTVVVCIALGTSARSTYADDPTPAATIPPTSTVEIAPSPELPSPVATQTPIALVAEPTATAIIQEEHGNAVPTIVLPTPAATEPASQTPPTDVLPTRAPASIPTATPAPAPGTAPQSPVPDVAPLPSPAQLEASARLRFGHGIPSQIRQWTFLIVPAAKKYHLSPLLLAAVITMESNGDPLAWNSGSDARGLMQVLHGPWDPKQNIFTGARMLAGFYAEFGDWKLAIAAYNAGPNAVIAYGGVPPYRETRDYVIIVTYLWDLYSNHTLSLHRKEQYSSTLRDLSHFKDARSKVKNLARAAGIADIAFSCRRNGCSLPQQTTPPPSLDPFWPVGSAPDPLQQVVPVGLAGR